MSNENKAGALVIANSQMIEEAVSLLDIVEESLFDAMDSVASDFADRYSWIGDFKMHDEGDCWVAPSHWNVADADVDAEDEHQPKAWFEINTINDADEYWINLLCSKSLSGSELGFKFVVDHSRFGGRRAWNNFVNTNLPSATSAIEDMGFKNIGRGVFFLPIHFDCKCLAKVWEENGEFAHDVDCLEPLREGLEKLKQAEEIFSQILSQAADSKAPAKAASRA